jgi:hypothetical protein
MADKNSGYSVLVVLGALLACATPSPERLLDGACRDQQCPTSGSARQTTGLTADSIGFELGPGPGSVTITAPLQFGDRLELLVRGQGSLSVTIESSACAPQCNVFPIELKEQWRWAPVGSTAGVGGTEFKLVIETSDQASTAALLDFRFR